MPNRVLKDSINESEGLSECSIFADDLYKRLINYADDYGRFNSDTTIMRARLYPRELEYVSEEDIINGLIELTGVGKLQFYTPQVFNQGGKKGVYGAFPNWSEHQRIRDSKKKCPDPADTSINDWYLRRFVPRDMRVRIVERDNFKCQACGKFVTSCRDAKRFVKLGSGMYHIDHIVPVLQGGRVTEENLRLLCPDCNRKRHKIFSFHEILDETLSSEHCDLVSPRVAASCGELRLESESESNPNPKKTKAQKCADRTPLEIAMDDFAAARKAMKKPLTDKARELTIKELEKLAPGDEAMQIAIINQSIQRGWQGVFPLKDDSPHPAPAAKAPEKPVSWRDGPTYLPDWAEDNG